MNLRNIFGQSSPEPIPSPDETIEISDSLSSPEAESEAAIDDLQQPVGNPSGEGRWYERNDRRLTADIAYMSESYPDFTLSILEDPDSSLDGSLCWQGVVKPQVMEDMAWEIIIVYQGLGGGKGDWAGEMSVYLADPSVEQVKETLGYIPGGFRKDADGAYTLSDHCSGGVRSAIEIASLFCQTVERMCIGELPEDYMEGDSLHLPSLA